MQLKSMNKYMIIQFVFVFFKECDQVHVEDVASDDNGQDLRCVIFPVTNTHCTVQ